jgi:general secretion pathway protein M
MNANTLALTRVALQRWQGMTARERLLVSWMGVALGLLLVWWLALGPVLRTWRDVPTQAALLEAQWLEMQHLASETRELQAQPPLNAAQAGAALKAATQALGTRGTLSLTNDRATLTFNSVTPELLRAWLVEARQNAHARPTEAQVTRDDSGISGRLVVALPGVAP